MEIRASKDRDVRGNPTWRLDSDAVSLIAVFTYASEAKRDADTTPERMALAFNSNEALVHALQLTLTAFNDLLRGYPAKELAEPPSMIEARAQAALVSAGVAPDWAD